MLGFKCNYCGGKLRVWNCVRCGRKYKGPSLDDRQAEMKARMGKEAKRYEIIISIKEAKGDGLTLQEAIRLQGILSRYQGEHEP